MNHQIVVYEGMAEEYMDQHEDPETRFPIPNEAGMRKTKSMTSSSQSLPSRPIQYQGDRSTVSIPSDLPFKPPGLMWSRQNAMTTSQLLRHKQSLINTSITRKKATTKRERGRAIGRGRG